MGRTRDALSCAAAVVLTFALAVSFADAASAAAPLKVREVFPGSTAAGGGAEYVVLQMTSDGQNDIDGQALRFYGSDGGETGSFVIPSDVANGGTQRTVFLATTATSAITAVARDFTLPAADRLDPAGGAVCFTGPLAVGDCVTWGSIPPLDELDGFPDPQAANAAAIPDGLALRRKIDAGCSTFLDAPDDSGDSAADFALVTPAPRNNASSPTEQRCVPDTSLQTFPANPSNQSAATFTYAESPDEPDATFECALDWSGALESGDFSSCPLAGTTVGPLADGVHRFAVRATGEGGTDATPATYTWTVDTVVPETTIESAPASPSSGFSVTYGYSSSEPLSTFRCQLDSGPVQVCAAGGKSYFGLADGLHVFRVWAVDNAGNKDPDAAEHAFSVVTALGDLTPPDTSITASPPNPSPRSDVSFSYASSEPGSRFECRLGGAAFGPCDPGGVTYRDLRNGDYTFQVRAIDVAGNVDSVPATYSWSLDAAPPETRFTKAPPGALRSPRGRPVSVTFRFTAEQGAGFRCRLDLQGPYRACTSPHRVKASPGRHVFEVFAVDRLGNEEGSPAFRVFRVEGPGGERSFFAQSGRFLSSLAATIAPSTLPREGLRPVSLSFSSTFENLDGSDIPPLRTMSLLLARGGVVETDGLPRCAPSRLQQRSSAAALAACREALVGRGSVDTAIRFPDGARLRSTAPLLLFNAGDRLLMHIYVTKPLVGVFVVPIDISRRAGRFGTELRARFPRIAAGYGQVTGFQMKLARTYRHGGQRRSYLLGGCPAPRGLNRVAFELARVEYRFDGGLRIRNSTLNTCKATG